MVARFRNKNRKSLWSRLVTYAALGLYLFALVILPALHRLCCEHTHAASCCEHSEHTPQPTHDSDDSCPICEFAQLVVPYWTVSEPLLRQPDIGFTISFILLAPSVAHATILPPCRAPPAV
ncbi:MAG: hypothetical protein LBI05_00765 [Planctomycetaceae bacterium]|jgi:hypothetical protein|nr:hypothetical protein [Planctomycetaceae bacterium]